MSQRIVFLPGFLGCKEDWEGVLLHLKNYRTLAIDLPSQNEVREVVEGLSADRVVLVGYSMGGRVALQLQRRFPHKWEKVIVIGAHPGVKDREGARKRDAQLIAQLENLPFEQFLKSWYEQPLFSSLKNRQECFQRVLERRRQQDPKKWVCLLRDWSMANFDPLTEFPSNTYFLYGEHDEKYAALYRKLSPHLCVQPIPGCGHAAHVEDSLACTKKIKEIIQFC